MKVIVALLALTATAIGAQPAPSADIITGCLPLTIADAAPFGPPRLEDYPASAELRHKPATVNLASHPLASRFRTMLRRGAAQGPTFADHYTIVTWGCGSACAQFAIVDAIDGRVFFPPEVRVVSMTHVMDAPRFRRDSALIVFAGAPNEGDDEGVFYYRWTGVSLKLVRFIRSDKTACDPLRAENVR